MFHISLSSLFCKEKLYSANMSASVSEVVVQTQPDVEALVQAAVSVLTNDMQVFILSV